MVIEEELFKKEDDERDKEPPRLGGAAERFKMERTRRLRRRKASTRRRDSTWRRTFVNDGAGEENERSENPAALMMAMSPATRDFGAEEEFDSINASGGGGVEHVDVIGLKKRNIC